MEEKSAFADHKPVIALLIMLRYTYVHSFLFLFMQYKGAAKKILFLVVRPLVLPLVENKKIPFFKASLITYVHLILTIFSKPPLHLKLM